MIEHVRSTARHVLRDASCASRRAAHLPAHDPTPDAMPRASRASRSAGGGYLPSISMRALRSCGALLRPSCCSLVACVLCREISQSSLAELSTSTPHTTLAFNPCSTHSPLRTSLQVVAGAYRTRVFVVLTIRCHRQPALAHRFRRRSRLTCWTTARIYPRAARGAVARPTGVARATGRVVCASLHRCRVRPDWTARRRSGSWKLRGGRLVQEPGRRREPRGPDRQLADVVAGPGPAQVRRLGSRRRRSPAPRARPRRAADAS